jgi:membrane-associated protease RseP (regulator of RpoE activity)
MLSPVLVVLLAAAPCLEGDPVTLAFKPNTSLESVAAWASKSLCVPHSVDAEVAKKTLPIAVSGTVSRKAARLILKAALASIDVTFRPEKGAFVLGPPSEKTVTCDDTRRAEVVKALRVVSDEERAVSREVFDSDWADCALSGARVVPSFRGGTFAGMKVFSIRPDSLWAAAGFLNGDQLLSVNDLPLDSPEQALNAWVEARKADRVEFKLRRRDAPARVIITVEPKKP